MKIGSPVWKMKMRLRRQPWLAAAPILLLLSILLGSLAVQAVKALTLFASLLWLIAGLLGGFWLGRLGQGPRRRKKTRS
ncbi:hypothetical protein JJB07_20005 [Tumebacillus sp. ITR2]|uniref:DUF4175 domain-containing protein n=1 Tax=Tumebacillus amylolyticus TaxID=2801339 RepID=A0ABS1JF19_9BACL|nr:hypothetical protein [Tumebacillus amylolyticus]MBL0388883.1 hypothetical protein [Tumebacillus amylolyticus]